MSLSVRSGEGLSRRGDVPRVATSRPKLVKTDSGRTATTCRVTPSGQRLPEASSAGRCTLDQGERGGRGTRQGHGVAGVGRGSEPATMSRLVRSSWWWWTKSRPATGSRGARREHIVARGVMHEPRAGVSRDRNTGIRPAGVLPRPPRRRPGVLRRHPDLAHEQHQRAQPAPRQDPAEDLRSAHQRGDHPGPPRHPQLHRAPSASMTATTT
jgi:hypothetical protein